MAKKTASLAVIVTFAAFVLRIARLDYVSLRGDESFSTMAARWDVGELFDLLATTEPHPPFYYTALHFWIQIAGDGEFSLRFLSLATGVLLVPVTFSLSKALFRLSLLPGNVKEAARPDGSGAGLLASLFGAINPLLLWHSQDTRSYSALALLAAASVLLSLGNLSRRRQWAGYVTVTYLAMLTHYTALYVVVAENLAAIALMLLRRKDMAGQARRWFSAQAVLAVAFAPWLWWAIRPLSSHTSAWVKPVDLLAFLERTLVALGAGGTTSAALRPAVLVAVLLVLVFSLAALARASRSNERLALAAGAFYLVGPAFLLFVFSLWRPMFDERHLVVLVAPFAFVASFAAARLLSKAWLSAILVTVLVVAPAVLSLESYFFDPNFNKSPGWRALVSEIRKQEKDGDYILLNYPDPTFTYYYRGPAPVGMLPSSVPVDRAETERSLAALATSYRRVWVVPAPAANWDADGLVETWLTAHLNKVGEASFSGVRLALFSAE